MTDRYDDERRAMARCEEQWLREPERDGCAECGEPCGDADVCDACAASRDDEDFRATPYATSPLPADDADVIPF